MQNRANRFYTSLLFVIPFTLLATTARAASTYFFDPYTDRLLAWSDDGITDAVQGAPVFTAPRFEDGSAIALSAPPVVWAPNAAVFATENGRVGVLDLSSGKARTLYTTKDECRPDAAYSGCIYSIAYGGPSLAYFLEHTPQDDDTVMELTLSGARALVTRVPGPSGPIWLRPSGELGALPYGKGLLSIPLPKDPHALSELTYTTTPFDSMAGFAAEGVTSSGDSQLVFFDFSAIQRFSSTAKAVAQLADTPGAAFDPCSGSVFFLKAGGSIARYHDGDATTPPLPVNPRACPVITAWQIVDRQGAPAGELTDRLDVIQGFPSGTAKVPGLETYSLGTGGSITLASAAPIAASGGTDLRIFENAFEHDGGMIFSEPGKVELSDGSKWVSTGCDCATPTPDRCAGMQVTNSVPGNGIAPWTDAAGGFAVNLHALGLSRMTEVRITDCGRSSPTPVGNPGPHAGFDLDAVIATPTRLK